jgi:hypothetical protein
MEGSEKVIAEQILATSKTRRSLPRCLIKNNKGVDGSFQRCQQKVAVSNFLLLVVGEVIVASSHCNSNTATTVELLQLESPRETMWRWRQAKRSAGDSGGVASCNGRKNITSHFKNGKITSQAQRHTRRNSSRKCIVTTFVIMNDAAVKVAYTPS